MTDPITTSFAKRWSAIALALLAPLALAACGGGDDDKKDLDQLDEQLTQDSGDPATEGALDEQILIDPQLAGTSDGNGDGAAADLSGMNLMSAGKPVSMSADELDVECDKDGACDSALEQDMAWAEKMPKAFPVFPNARLDGAAGIDNGKCNIRGARFFTANSVQEVVDYYYTRAKKAGYSAEYIKQDGMRALGGTREQDDTAYYITFTPKDGKTLVEIIASKG